MQSQQPVEQVGGNHYAPAAAYGHWDMVDQYNVAYLEANASKYVSRWGKKGGKEDLLKAISYIDKRLASMSPPNGKEPSNSFAAQYACGSEHRDYRNFTVPTLKIMKWFDAASVPLYEQGICLQILCWETRADLEEAKDMINHLLRNA